MKIDGVRVSISTFIYQITWYVLSFVRRVCKMFHPEKNIK